MDHTQPSRRTLLRGVLCRWWQDCLPLIRPVLANEPQRVQVAAMVVPGAVSSRERMGVP